MRVFVDTNVVISALLFPNGKVAEVFSHLLEKHTVIISSYTKEECKELELMSKADVAEALVTEILQKRK